MEGEKKNKLDNMPNLNERFKVRFKYPSTASARQRNKAEGSNIDDDVIMEGEKEGRKESEIVVSGVLAKGGVQLGSEEFAAEFGDNNDDESTDGGKELVDGGNEVEVEGEDVGIGEGQVDGDNEGGSGSGSERESGTGTGDGSEHEEEESRQIVIGRGAKGHFKGITSHSQASSTASSGRKKRPRDVSTWFLTGPAPDGPENCEVIPSFGGHRAMLVWKDPSVGDVLTVRARWRALQDLRRWRLSEKGSKFIKESSIGHLGDVISDNIDMPLITAFIERWQPDTNTFMLPFGEMTMCLHDVNEILKIAISGRVCTASDDILKNPVKSACKFFGRDEQDLRRPYCEEKKAFTILGKGVLVNAIEDRVVGSKSVDIQVQGYLMSLLGQTLFVDKTGDRVTACLSPLLSDLDEIDGYAWGAATLAHLYRELGKASRAKCMQVAGCLTLLQTWIYEHFPCFRPRKQMDVIMGADTPRACCWLTRKEPLLKELLYQHRRTLDSLTPEMVTWMPYGPEPGKKHPMSLFTGYIRFMDIVEPYRPARCLRQFGYRQIRPPNMPTPDVAHRPPDSLAYSLSYGKSVDDLWNDSDAHKLDLSNAKYVRAVPSYAVDDSYYEWYKLRSHPLLIDPSRLPKDVHKEQGITDTEFRQRIVSIFGDILSLDEAGQMAQMPRILKEMTPLLVPFQGEKDEGKDQGKGKEVVPYEGEKDQGKDQGKVTEGSGAKRGRKAKEVQSGGVKGKGKVAETSKGGGRGRGKERGKDKDVVGTRGGGARGRAKGKSVVRRK